MFHDDQQLPKCGGTVWMKDVQQIILSLKVIFDDFNH